MIIEDTYIALVGLNLAKSTARFSIDYLGRSGRYFDYLRSSHAQPSIAALTTLAMRVTSLSDIFGEDARRAPQTKTLDDLADALWAEVERRSYADAWKARRAYPARVVQGASARGLQSGVPAS
jgi:hypothetical protein